jgi:uncharacterized protein YcfJ
MTESPPSNEKDRRLPGMVIGMLIGISIGVALGIGLDNMAFLGVGVAIGAGLGAAFSVNQQENGPNDQE